MRSVFSIAFIQELVGNRSPIRVCRMYQADLSASLLKRVD